MKKKSLQRPKEDIKLSLHTGVNRFSMASDCHFNRTVNKVTFAFLEKNVFNSKRKQITNPSQHFKVKLKGKQKKTL